GRDCNWDFSFAEKQSAASIEPESEADEFAAEDALEAVSRFGARADAGFPVWNRGRALHPGDQIQRGGGREDELEVDPARGAGTPERDELISLQDRLGLVEELQPALDHLNRDAAAGNDRVLLGARNPFVIVVGLGEDELPRLMAQGDHRLQVSEGR